MSASKPDPPCPVASESPDPVRTTLAAALEGLAFRVEPGRFALLGFPEPPQPGDLQVLESAPGQLVREADETTLLVRQERLAEVLERHPQARVERELCWIRFQAAMGWEVVGFLATVTGRLAAAGVPLGAVCGYSRDHLFVAARHLAGARAVLQGLATEEPAG